MIGGRGDIQNGGKWGGGTSILVPGGRTAKASHEVHLSRSSQGCACREIPSPSLHVLRPRSLSQRGLVPHPAAQDEGLTSTLSQKHLVWQLELQNRASLLQACEDREIVYITLHRLPQTRMLGTPHKSSEPTVKTRNKME